MEIETNAREYPKKYRITLNSTVSSGDHLFSLFAEKKENKNMYYRIKRMFIISGVVCQSIDTECPKCHLQTVA